MTLKPEFMNSGVDANMKVTFFQMSKAGSWRQLESKSVFFFPWRIVLLWKRIVYCFRVVVLKKTLETPLDCQEFKPFNPKGNQSCISTGRTDAEVLVLWPPDVKSQLIGKAPDAGKDGGQKEKRVADNEMVR